MRRKLWIAVVLCVSIAAGAWSCPGFAGATQPTAVAGGRVIADPHLDPTGTLRDARAFALTTDPTGGPFRTEFHLGPADTELLPAGVDLSDFYARTTYFTPEHQPAGTWSIGFSFWAQKERSSYGFLIRVSNGAVVWSFVQQTGDTIQTLHQGDLGPGAVDLTVGALNSVSVVVEQGIAILSGNDMAVAATVDLGETTGSGDVLTQVEFVADDASAPNSLRFLISDFAVWDLSQNDSGTAESSTTIRPTQAPEPTAASSAGNMLKLQETFDQLRSAALADAPAVSLPAGTLQQQTVGISSVPAGVELADVYVAATFANPADLTTRFDMAIGFRNLNNGAEYRFVVASDGGWGLSIGTGGPIEQGIVSNVDATPGSSNTLEVIAQGATGLLAINGVVVRQIDLSGNLGAGDVYVGSGMYDTYTVDGRLVPYSNFLVYALPV